MILAMRAAHDGHASPRSPRSNQKGEGLIARGGRGDTNRPRFNRPQFKTIDTGIVVIDVCVVYDMMLYDVVLYMMILHMIDTNIQIMLYITYNNTPIRPATTSYHDVRSTTSVVICVQGAIDLIGSMENLVGAAPDGRRQGDG